MSLVSESAMERKSTRPLIITPENRPAAYQVSPTGHRKIPDAVTPTPPPSSSSDPAKKYEQLVTDLAISDDDDLTCVTSKPTQPKPKSTILVGALRGPGVCGYRFMKGGKKGQLCSKRCSKGLNLCGVHRAQKQQKKPFQPSPQNSNPATSETRVEPATSETRVEPTTSPSSASASEIEDLRETKAKLERLEKVVLNLMKSDLKKKIKAKHTRISNRPIQKIRVYKLKRDETYKLLRYKDGMPVFECKNKLYTVPLPKYISRPIPNGHWSLIGGPDGKMIWKEV